MTILEAKNLKKMDVGGLSGRNRLGDVHDSPVHRSSRSLCETLVDDKRQTVEEEENLD